MAGFTAALELYSQHRTVDERLVADLQVRFIDSFRRSSGCNLDAELFRAFTLMHLYGLARVCLHPRKRMSSMLRGRSRAFLSKLLRPTSSASRLVSERFAAPGDQTNINKPIAVLALIGAVPFKEVHLTEHKKYGLSLYL